MLRKLLSVLYTVVFLATSWADGPEVIRIIRKPDNKTAYVTSNGTEVASGLVTVAAPTVAPALNIQLGVAHVSNYTFEYPYTKPTPAGTYQISNAIVDKTNKAGAWSTPVTVTLQSGWFVYGGTWNQPLRTDDVGIIWKVYCVSTATPTSKIYTGSTLLISPQINHNGQVVNFCGNSPKLQLLNSLDMQYFHYHTLRQGGTATTVAPAPTVVVSQIPNQTMQIAYSRLAENGETALSPALTYTPPTPSAGVTAAQSCQLSVKIATPHPQGTIALRYYYRLQGETDWKRLPAPHCYGTPSTENDWNFPVQDMQAWFLRTVADAPVHSAAGNPQSEVTALHKALQDTYEDIVVEVKELEVRCPIFDPYGTGAEGTGLPHKFHRRVSTISGGLFNLTQATGLTHTYWPMLVVYNQYSTWVGARITGINSVGITYSDFSGGQCFGNRFIDCRVALGNSPVGLTVGVLADYTQAAAGHTASEQSFVDCFFNADVPLWISGNQTANWRLSRTHATSGSRFARRHSVIYTNCPNQIRFTNGLYSDSVNGLVCCEGLGANLIIDDLWVDQSFHCLFHSNCAPMYIKVTGGKLNCWILDSGANNLATSVSNAYVKLVFDSVATQFNSTPRLDISSSFHRGTDIRFTDTNLADYTRLREPTFEQYKAEWSLHRENQSNAGLVQPAELGFRIVIPANNTAYDFTVPVPGHTATVPAVSQTVSLKINGSKSNTNIPIQIPQRSITIPATNINVTLPSSVNPERTIIMNSLSGTARIQTIPWLP